MTTSRFLADLLDPGAAAAAASAAPAEQQGAASILILPICVLVRQARRDPCAVQITEKC